MSVGNADTKPPQVFPAFVTGVAAGDSYPAPLEQLRERAHTGAGYADKVNGTLIRWIKKHVV
jgi:hypothetical protein